ncbi:MAG: PH domain-containing protein [Chloracidobacterium sp.]|nr:PH domain-containing protein [Chloracidobacterium sp.]
MREDLHNALESAIKRGTLNPLIGKGMFEFAEKQLSDAERVLILGTYNVGIIGGGETMKIKPFDIKNKTAGVLLVTTMRVIHCQKILFSTKVEQIQIEKIDNMESKGSLIFSVLRLQSMTNIMEIDIPKKELDIVTKAISEAIEDRKKPASQPAGKDDDAIEKIKELGKLREIGLITEEEFSKKKEELLNRI